MITKGYIRNQIVRRINRLLVKVGIMKLFFPSEIYLAVNSICNARCKMCDIGLKNIKTDFFKMYDGRGDLDRSTFDNIIKQIKNKGINLSLKMTEPLLYPGLDYVLKTCKEHKISVSLTTNGILLEKNAEQLVKYGLRGLQLSLNGPKELHDEITGIPGSYDKIKKGLFTLQRYKQKVNSSHPKVILRMTMFENNHKKLIESLDHFKEEFKGVHTVLISHLNFTEDNKKEIKVDKLDINAIYNQIEKIKNKKYPFKVKFFPEMNLNQLKEYYQTYDELKEHKKCSSLYKSLAILSNGEVTPHIRCLQVYFGNVNTTSLFKIWNGKEYKKFRKNIWHQLPTSCRRCCQVMTK